MGATKKRYRYEIVPNPAQQRALARAFGCARVVYNDYIAFAQAERAAGRSHPSAYDALKLLTAAKKTPARAWLSEVSAVALQQSVIDAGAAYTNFFASATGTRKGRKVGYPKFKSKHRSADSIRLTGPNFTVNGGWQNTEPFTDSRTRLSTGRLAIPRVGDIPARWSRALPSKPSSVTVQREPDGRYFASFVVDVPDREPVPPTHAGRAAGLDMGLTDFAAVAYSDGTRELLENPRFARRAARKLARAQRLLSRKQKGSKNRARQVMKVARLHRHVKNQRLDHAHQVASILIRENQAITVETLSITGMAKTRLAKSIHDAGWGQFLTILEAKALEHGRAFTRMPRLFPSSQICAVCTKRDEPKPLNVRAWECPNCQTVLHRDFNAATNLLVAGGHPENLNACGEDVRRRLASNDETRSPSRSTNPPKPRPQSRRRRGNPRP